MPSNKTTYPREYETWCRIKSRCYNLNRPDYKHYGGKGIKVCDRWLESFENFYKDMGPRPLDKTSIDRLDSSGDYEPSNCRWANWIEQAQSLKLSGNFKPAPKKQEQILCRKGHNNWHRRSGGKRFCVDCRVAYKLKKYGHR